MKKDDTLINNLCVIGLNRFEDDRGLFIKMFNDAIFQKLNIEFDIKEVYFSNSNKNAVRGMHFQKPPYDHNKLVFVQRGCIVDVVLDIRKNSPTYGKYFSIELSENSNKAIYIGKGLAHGFLSLQDNTTVLYMQDSIYDKKSDDGVHFDSFDFQWSVKNPIISERDSSFTKFLEYETPF